MLLETSTKGSGKMTKLMGSESTTMSTVPSIWDIGSTICSTVLAEKHGSITPFIMVFTIWVKKKESANMIGATDPNLWENG